MPRRTSSPRKNASKRSSVVLQDDEELRVGEARDTLIADRQTRLVEIRDRHDDLVREMFHMEKFRLMHLYEPEKAKQDNSEVFQMYQIEKGHVLHNNEAGPSRRTRKSHVQDAQMMRTVPSTPRPPIANQKGMAPPRTQDKNHASASAPVVVNKGKARAVPLPSPSAKAKGKARDTPEESRRPSAASSSAPRTSGRPQYHSRADSKSRAAANARSMPPPPTKPPDDDTVTIYKASRNALPRKRRKISSASSEESESPTPSPEKVSVLATPTNRRKAPAASNGMDAATPTGKQRQTRQAEDTNILASTPARNTRGGRKRQETDAAEEAPAAKKSKFANAKSLTLIVRRPLPNVSHPWQLPAPARFNNSLPDLFASFSVRDDALIHPDAVTDLAHRNAVLLEKYHRLCQEGKMLPVDEYERAKQYALEDRPAPVSDDVWAHIVKEIEKAYDSRIDSAEGAGVIAGVVETYWTATAARDEKRREDELKRVERLAKETMKLIVRQWKEAVKYVREQERQKREAEEIRVGRKHLDEILDKSGEILDIQQGLLTRRTRSRSPSTASSRSEDSDDDDDQEERDSDDERNLSEEALTDTDVPTELEEDDDDLAGQDGDGRALSPQSSMSDEFIAQLFRLSPVNDTTVQVLDRTSSQLSESSVEPTTPADFVTPTPSTTSVVLHPWDPEGRNMEIEGLDTSIHRKSAEALGDAQITRIGWEDALAPAAGDMGLPFDDLVLSSEHQLASDDDPVVRSKSTEDEPTVPEYLEPYAVAPVHWDPKQKVMSPLLLRGVLRPYQQDGLEWLAHLHTTNQNGILADEMGLGKTIQTIALLAHLACDRGIWGPHLIIVPTSVILNWEMEFKKFLPGFKVLSYHGNTMRRRELRKGWSDKHHFNVCITSYTLATRDVSVFKRRSWYYMILDEAHMIKNFKSQRWNVLLLFKSFRRLLLTGTPLQNNLTELWSLLQFLKAGSEFATQKEFGDWFSNPLEKAIEMGSQDDEETLQRVEKLHKILRTVLLRRLKNQVERQLPRKHEHLLLCPLSKRQRFLYDEFMSRAQTQEQLQSGVYQKIANILMQLRKVCNHPDLFEERPIVTSFAMSRSAIAGYEVKELLVRRRLCLEEDEHVNLDLLGLRFVDHQEKPCLAAVETRRLDYSPQLRYTSNVLGEPPPKDLRTIAGFRAWKSYQEQVAGVERRRHLGYVNRMRCDAVPLIGSEVLRVIRQCTYALRPWSALDLRFEHWHRSRPTHSAILSYAERADAMRDVIDKFAFATPPVVARDMPSITLAGHESSIQRLPQSFDALLHQPAVKLQVAFPDPSLLQFDCGKLQHLADLLREKKAGGHRVLIFTQMTRILDILEIFLNFHGYLYLRLDGATKIEDRQYVTERFNVDDRVFCFIASSRSGGVGINLTGADTVVFYDSDFNPQMDRQCEDRAHRIGQMRDVHIYRFVSQYTVEEAMLRKANQKRSLDNLVIQRGEFDWRRLIEDDQALTTALGEVEDREDAHAAAVATREAIDMDDADLADFEDETLKAERAAQMAAAAVGEVGEEEEEGGTVSEYMISLVTRDYDHFAEWRT
ncbi:SNF2 family N-terminal domain-containing protein [Schizophyllum amplum]|uniref:DNA helicase n=1 Tax=Schizophyllum amplum TaxID=97359 RepID=A0A550CVX5_9AGAR|nr:SNF2 family N-terminal domain-containing protein [Auriculariopsis ampla]